MIDSKTAYHSLLNDSRLDQLLSKAREQTAKLSSGSMSPTTTLEELNVQTEVINQKCGQVTRDLSAILAERKIQREEKVATIMHMIDVAAKLLA
jgi:hypothetical protein